MVKAKVLYVDDEIINLRLFEAILEKKFQILTAGNGLSGLRILKENPDLQAVISDMKMPNMSGIEFIKESALILPHIPYYILTGFEITDQIQEALNTGLIRKYFRKPTNLNEISAEIERAIKKD